MRKSRKLLKRLAVAVLTLVVLLLLFVVAFVFNPFEGSLRDVRDVVPREVDFFVRKTELAADFETGGGKLDLGSGEVPQPAFWDDLTDARSWQQVEQGPWLTSLRRDYTRPVQDAVRAMAEVEQNSSGMLDLARDLVGNELVVAGYFEDRTGAAAQPLAQPWWCVYARVGWRLRAAWGLIGYGVVQEQVRGQGIELSREGDVLVIRIERTGETFYAARELDCLMLANNRHQIEQSLRLALGAEGEEPFGQSGKYTGGVVEPIERWRDANSVDDANALEYSLTTNVMDSFRRFAQQWPDADNVDSMNERVMARFVNLKGWNSVSGALLFEPEELSVLGEVVLNSHMHTGFQSAFYKAEKQVRREWLDPFLRMVPRDACAAAALRMPVGDFLNAMFDSLLPEERELLDDRLRRCKFMGQDVADTRDLISRLSLALLPRTGFVFRRNIPDPQIQVTARSPVPQIAWVFWLKPGQSPVVEGVVDMLRGYAPVFRFDPVYHLPIEGLPEPVTEFCNAQIPGTGELATIVFSEFFVLSNSGPLIKEILRTRYDSVRSLLASDEYQRVERELPQAVNGFVWLDGPNLEPVLDDYRAASVAQNKEPDPEWMMSSRPAAEEIVRRERYSRYGSKAAMPRELREGEFREAVTAYLKEQWSRGASGLSSADLPQIDQFKAIVQLFENAYLEVELESNYIRFLGKLMARW